MASFLPDTSCMIPAVCRWHEHHYRAAQEIQRRLQAAETLLVAGPVVVEAYAVLTRLPRPHRLSPADALTLLEVNFIEVGSMVAVDGEAYPILLRQVRELGIAGGQTYDALIASCVLQMEGATLLTFNERHFLPFSSWGLQVVVPAEV